MPTEVLSQKPIYNYFNYVSELRSKLKRYSELAKEHLTQAKANNKKYYDRNRDAEPLKLKKNDLVLVLIPKKKQKFDEPYEGPYRVIEDQGPVLALILRKGKSVKVHKDRIKLARADYGNRVPPPID